MNENGTELETFRKSYTQIEQCYFLLKRYHNLNLKTMFDNFQLFKILYKLPYRSIKFLTRANVYMPSFKETLIY